MKKTILAFIAAVSLCGILSAQTRKPAPKKWEIRHEFSVYGGGGLSTLQYKLSEGAPKKGFGGDFGLGYAYRITPQWSLATGAGISFFRASASVADTIVTAGLTDEENQPFDLYTAFAEHREQQNALYLHIPLTVRFGKGNFYGQAGIKAGIPLKSSYHTQADVNNRGFYTNMESWAESQEFAGFGTFAGKKADGDIALKTAFFASLEGGYRFALSDVMSLYLGLYADFGLNNVAGETQDKHLIQWNHDNPEEFALHSVLASTQTKDNSRMTDKITPLAAGMRLGLLFGIKTATKEAKAADAAKRAEAEAKRLAAAEERRRKAEERRRKATTPDIIEPDKQTEEEQTEEALLAAAKAQMEAKEEQHRVEQQQYAEAVGIVQEAVIGYAVDQTSIMSVEIKAELDRKIELMERHPNMKLIVEGHTCNTGTHQVNMLIGQRRADAVKKYMVERGISPDRIQAVSKAETEPMVPNTTEENKRKNRRVELKVF